MKIKSVELPTHLMNEMKDFYVKTLELDLIDTDDESFTVAVGDSQLTFTERDVEGHPYYHFAFNIPANKFQEAKVWVKNKVELNTEDHQDDVHFGHFPAYAFYFSDPAGNVVEFISRYEISGTSNESFSSKSIIDISEMSLTVDDALSVGQKLIDAGIEERDGDPLSATALNFMGDQATGVFLLLNQPGRRWIFSDKISKVFPLEVSLTNQEIKINKDKELVINNQKVEQF